MDKTESKPSPVSSSPYSSTFRIEFIYFVCFGYVLFVIYNDHHASYFKLFLSLISTLMYIYLINSDPGYLMPKKGTTTVTSTNTKSQPFIMDIAPKDATTIHHNITPANFATSQNEKIFSINIEDVLDAEEVNKIEKNGKEKDYEYKSERRKRTKCCEINERNYTKLSPDLKYCKYCFLKQKLRSKHCRSCNKCVRRFDHHCFWISICLLFHSFSFPYLHLP